MRSVCIGETGEGWSWSRAWLSAARVGLGLFLLSFLTLTALAAPVADLQAANQLYDAGQFAEAIAAYDRLEPKTAHVYYNLGNACYRAEQFGRAVLSYERARRLAPRDPDVLANLKFTQQRLGVAEINTPPRAVGRLIDSVVYSRTLREWTVYELVSLWFTVALVAVAVWRRSVRTACVVAALTGLVVWLFCAAMLAHRLYYDRRAPAAVTLAKHAEARFAPLPTATVHFKLAEGTRVRIREDRGSWVSVERADGQTGWVPASAVEPVGVE